MLFLGIGFKFLCIVKIGWMVWGEVVFIKLVGFYDFLFYCFFFVEKVIFVMLVMNI